MKKRIIVLSAAALALAACTVEVSPEISTPSDSHVGPVSFTASLESDSATKAVLDLNGSSKPQTFWENGDAINVFTSADGESHSGKGYQFSTSLLANSTSATFTYDGDDFGDGNYFAVYPYRSHTRGVNYTTYRLAGNIIPESQTLAAGTFDKSAALAVAYAEGGSSLEFKNVTALLKFRVSDADIVAGRIEVDAADAISGTFRADYNTSTGEITLETYSGVNNFNFVNFTIDGSTALATGTDYYVVVRPAALSSNLKIYLNGTLVKTISNGKLASLQRNKIYNLGTLSLPVAAAEKVLAFDFSGSPLPDWPTAKRNSGFNPGTGTECTYPLYGDDYVFVPADCGGASASQVWWQAPDAPKAGYFAINAQYRYLGLPAIVGYKLVKVVCHNVELSSTAPKMGITTLITASAAHPADSDYVTGGEVQTWAAGGGKVYTYSLSGTAANTRYYLYGKAKGAIDWITLTYEPV